MSKPWKTFEAPTLSHFEMKVNIDSTMHRAYEKCQIHGYNIPRAKKNPAQNMWENQTTFTV